MHDPQKATTLEIWSARPHSGLIKQSLVRKQHVGQLLPELLLSVTSCFSGWVCLVSCCFSSHTSLVPFPMMLWLVQQKAGIIECVAMDQICEENAKNVIYARAECSLEKDKLCYVQPCTSKSCSLIVHNKIFPYKKWSQHYKAMIFVLCTLQSAFKQCRITLVFRMFPTAQVAFQPSEHWAKKQFSPI